MTVSTIGSVAEFDTNGVTTNFPFYFKFLANEDLSVTYVNPLGLIFPLTLGTDYTANGAGDESGGSIATTLALAGPGQLIVSREMDAYQLTSLRNQGKFLAETHEDVFDRLTMLIQQGFSVNNRSLNRPFGKDYYDAEARRIENVADPIDDQDATTKHWSREYLTSLISLIQGPVNNAANVFYKGPDDLDYVVQDMSSKSVAAKGAALIGYQGRTVADRLGDQVSVKDYGATGDGVTDDTAAIQLALDSSRVVHFPPGDYRVSTTLLIPSNTTITGSGYRSRVFAPSTFAPINLPWAGGFLPVLFGNSGIATSSPNTHIEISGLYMDSSAYTGGMHNVHFRNTQHCHTHHCTFSGGSDATAHTLCTNFMVTNNFAFGQGNCCYDQWEGCNHGLVADNVGYVTFGYGMLLTGDTSLNTTMTSTNVSFIGNIIIGPNNGSGSVGVWLQSGSNLASNCYNCRVEGNYVQGFQVGYRATGGGNHTISGNHASNCPAGGIILSAEVIGNYAQNCAVSANILINCGNAASAPILVQQGSSNNSITGNITGATTSTYAAILDAGTVGNVLSGNAFVAGSSGYVSNASSTNNASNTQTGYSGQGTFTASITSSGGGVPIHGSQLGSYNVTGNMVHFTLRVSISGFGTMAAGNLTVSGLPFANANIINNLASVSVSATNLQAAITQPVSGRILQGASSITLHKWVSGSLVPLANTDITSVTDIVVSGSYRKF